MSDNWVVSPNTNLCAFCFEYCLSECAFSVSMKSSFKVFLPVPRNVGSLP